MRVMAERLLTKKDRALVCRIFPEAKFTRSGSRVGYWEVRGHEIRSFSKLMKIAAHYHVIQKLPPEIQAALAAVANAPPPPVVNQARPASVRQTPA